MNKCLPMLLKTQGFKMKTVDKVWFLSHSDWIYNNQHKLQSRPCAEFVITWFVINSFGCPYYGYAIDKITLGNLIKLWNNGFVYKDFPLIHYRIFHGDSSTHIAYIYRGKMISLHRPKQICSNRRSKTDFSQITKTKTIKF